MPSISYYILLRVLHFTGLKRQFSQVPLPFLQLRKNDVYHPKSRYLHERIVAEIKKEDGILTQFKAEKPGKGVVLLIHGGAFVYGPGKHHWDLAEKLLKTIGGEVWVCNYPKVPEHAVGQMSAFIDWVYAQALERFEANTIRIVGDSAGGSLTLALTQRLLQNGKPVPAKLVAISPVADARFCNPKCEEVDPKDAILSIKGVASAALFCGETELSDPMLSPLMGSFVGFPPTVLFLAEYDITYPDQVDMVAKMKREGAPVEVIFGAKMPHIWPLLPFMHEAKVAQKQLLEALDLAAE